MSTMQDDGLLDGIDIGSLDENPPTTVIRGFMSFEVAAFAGAALVVLIAGVISASR